MATLDEVLQAARGLDREDRRVLVTVISDANEQLSIDEEWDREIVDRMADPVDGAEETLVEWGEFRRDMESSLARLREEAMKLSSAERADLACHLLDFEDAPGADVSEEDWEAELARRLADPERRTPENLKSWDEVEREIRASLSLP